MQQTKKKQEFEFFKASMPSTRLAEYYLGYYYSCVFIDFARTEENRIRLVRISFDGFGCCGLNGKGLSLDATDSAEFIKEMESEELNQETIARLVFEIIRINKDLIWLDALEKYGLIEG